MKHSKLKDLTIGALLRTLDDPRKPPDWLFRFMDGDATPADFEHALGVLASAARDFERSPISPYSSRGDIYRAAMDDLRACGASPKNG